MSLVSINLNYLRKINRIIQINIYISGQLSEKNKSDSSNVYYALVII